MNAKKIDHISIALNTSCPLNNIIGAIKELDLGGPWLKTIKTSIQNQ